MDETLILVTFDDDSHAFEALAEVKALGASGRLDLREAGVVRRSGTGRLSLADQPARHRRDGSAAGGLVGALVGILGGPVGVLVGGAAGILAGGVHDGGDAEDTDDVLARIAHDIPSGSTALVARCVGWAAAPRGTRARTSRLRSPRRTRRLASRRGVAERDAHTIAKVGI
jgi:uncharacterized membrane protein